MRKKKVAPAPKRIGTPLFTRQLKNLLATHGVVDFLVCITTHEEAFFSISGDPAKLASVLRNRLKRHEKEAWAAVFQHVISGRTDKWQSLSG